MSIATDELNYLIQRYFQECNLKHSAYTFQAEAETDFSSVIGSQIPPGALITLLQKGLLYCQLERAISHDQPINGPNVQQLSLIDVALREGTVPVSKGESTKGDEHASSIQLDQSNSIMLSEHTDDVICCNWTSDGRYLATGSADNTAIIWDFSNPNEISHLQLAHEPPESTGAAPGQYQISTLAWSPDDQFLSTGCADGSIHCWNHEGEEIFSVSSHHSAIHVIKYDPSGNCLLSGASNSHVEILSSKNGELIKSIDLDHKGVLDAAWRNEISFAVCCNDGMVVYFENLESDPLEIPGHTAPVNAVAWSPNKDILASGSDDKHIMLWNAEQGDSAILKGHTSTVYALRWESVLASASLDNTIRIWDTENLSCLHVLVGHNMSIYALCFSPDQQLLASGSSDQSIKIWNAHHGQLVTSCVGNQNIFDVQWDPTGHYIAGCLEGGTTLIIPTANLQLQQ